jgi:hypothetical protein
MLDPPRSPICPQCGNREPAPIPGRCWVCGAPLAARDPARLTREARMAQATRADWKWYATAIVLAVAVVFFGIASESLIIAAVVGAVMTVVLSGIRAGTPDGIDGADRLAVFVRATVKLLLAVFLAVGVATMALMFVIYLICMSGSSGSLGG